MAKTHKAPETQNPQYAPSDDPFKPLAVGDGTVVLSVSQYQRLLQRYQVLADEQSLADFWLTPAEDEAWADL